MPTIKLLSGFIRRPEGAGKVLYKAGDTIHDVSEHLLKGRRYEVINTAVEPTLDELRAHALGLGILAKPQWNAEKLAKEIAAHGNT